MSPPPTKYLDMACVRTATANFTFFDLKEGGNLIGCSIQPLKIDTAIWRLQIAKACLFTATLMLILFAVFLLWSQQQLICQLCNLPSHQLHRELEIWYTGALSKKGKKELRDRMGKDGRYPNVVFTTDENAMKRKITIVKDLYKVPTEAEIARHSKKLKTYAMRATELPPASIHDAQIRYPAPAVPPSIFGLGPAQSDVAVPQPAVVNGDQGAEEFQINGPPPAYRYALRDHV
ncbi:hypothetical protein EG329_007528 [Mollisiaceae sp. DMI_Dod_QoI]|nr:hypothetical protein EG329_007528 [Helotiales sp. DMI_Dod_QoI]